MFSLRIQPDDQNAMRVYVYNDAKRFREIGNPDMPIEDRFKAGLTNLEVLSTLDDGLQPELPLEGKDAKSPKNP